MSKTARIVAAVVVTAAAILTLNPQLIQAAVALDAAVIAGALAPKLPRISSGSETRWTADPQIGIPYAVGRCAVAGDRRFERSAGAVNKFKNVVSIYSVGPIHSYEAFYANNVAVPFTSDGGEGATGYYKNRMWMKRQYGAANEPYLHWTATGTKDTPADHGGMPAQWTPAHKLSGYAASLQGAEWDQAKYAGGVMPPPLMVGKWVLVYDPRLDDTYPGGAGPCRYADPSDKAAYLAAKATWVWSDDPNLHGLMWALGAWTGSPARMDLPLVQTHGLGLAIEDVDVAAFVEAANVSRTNNWKIGGRVYSTDNSWEVLKSFLQAGGAEPVLLGDRLSCFVNTPKVSVATLRGPDAVGEVSLDAAVPFNERINTVWPSWTVEELNWEVTPAPAPVQVQAYVDVDGGVRSKELPLPLIQHATHAGQITRYFIEDSRELGNIVIPVPPKWGMWLEPGLCITADEPEWCMNGQKLIIRQRVFDPATMIDVLICRTETDGKHAFALGQTTTPPDTPALTGVDPNVVPLPSGDAWAVVGGVIAGESGSLPGIVIAGEAELYDAVSIVVDYRRLLPLPVGDWKSATFPASAKTLVVQGVEPGATYQVRVRYITAKGVENPDNNTDLGNIVVGGVDAGAVGGYSAAGVIDGMRTQALTIAAEALRQGTWRIATDEILKIAGGATLRMLQEQLGIIVDGIKTFVDFQRSVDSNGNAMWALTAQNSNGRVTGVKNLLTGEGIGKITLAADILEAVDPDGENPRFILRYGLDNRLILNDVYIELLEVGAVKTASIDFNQVTIPLITTSSSTIFCDGTEKTIISHTVDLTADATLFVTCFLSSHFPSGDRDWTAILYIDGTAVYTTGGANGEANMPLGGALFCSAGAVEVKVTLNSHSSVNVTSRTLSSLGPMR